MVKDRMIPKRYAVIGAGPTGITTIKCLKEEGMEPVCFERTNHVGGLWRFHDNDVDGLASVMKTTVINNSKEMGAFSDFPPKAEYPNYMHNKQVHEYLISYANAFDVVRHIQLGKEVVEVSMADDYDETGRLKVVVKDTRTGMETREVFDGVFVCTGHHVFPNMPSFPGMEKFEGKMLHTHGLKKVNQFEDQNVVVVGVGNSGMDAAVEISSVAKQVYLSTRRGAWVVPRVGPWGLPFDIQFQRRWFDILFRKIPYSIVCWFSELMINHRFDHSLYNLKPEHRIWSQHATISDSLPIKLLSGTVVIRKNIREFVENGVIFDGEEKGTECDAVVFATGYNIRFPFLQDKLTTVKNNEINLYKYIFPPHLKHPTLALCGLVQVIGAGFPTIEAQSRVATLVMNGKLCLPSMLEMEADIRRRKEIISKRFTHSQRHTIQADYIPYLDELYSLIGAKPNFLKMFFTDTALFCTLFFGPSLPYQYRLQGPHAWPGAREAISDSRKRIMEPLRHNILLPFLQDKLTTVKNNEINLYKYIFPPHLKHPTLALCGLVQVIGAGFPTIEAQSRMVALVMNGKLCLPSMLEMLADIRRRKDIILKRFTHSQRHTIQADYIPYLDELYLLIRAKPNFLKMFFTIRFYFALFFRPVSTLPIQTTGTPCLARSY